MILAPDKNSYYISSNAYATSSSIATATRTQI